MKENILHQCLKKKNEQSEALRMGFLSINDLVAVEGQYHPQELLAEFFS